MILSLVAIARVRKKLPTATRIADRTVLAFVRVCRSCVLDSHSHVAKQTEPRLGNSSDDDSAMNLSAALRSSASLLSSHSRSSALLPRAALRCPRRCYSDEKPSSSGQQPTQEAHEKPQEKPPSPEAQALKAKDAEVADLTVRRLATALCFCSLFFPFRAVYGTCKLTF